MSQLNARTRAVLKAALDRFLGETCTITRDNVTIDEYGGTVISTQIVAVSVRCRLIRSSGEDAKLIGSQETMQDTYRLIAPVGTPFTVDQQVVVDGNRYQVIALQTELSDELYEYAIVRRYR